jgi:NADP-dependent 3-hydroxy acid dehydrogenase YdfG
LFNLWEIINYSYLSHTETNTKVSDDSIVAGSVVLITGASSGLGKELAIVYSQRRAKLVITGRNKQRLMETHAECVKNGAEV